MKNYYRVMLGPRSTHAVLGREQGFIGADYEITQDLTADLTDNWREFNQKYRPIFLAVHSDKTMIGAGLACGALWTVARAFKKATWYCALMALEPISSVRLLATISMCLDNPCRIAVALRGWTKLFSVTT